MPHICITTRRYDWPFKYLINKQGAFRWSASPSFPLYCCNTSHLRIGAVFKMKCQCSIVALIISIANVLNVVHSGTPATLCLRRSCTSVWSGKRCNEEAWLQIRNGYFGYVKSDSSQRVGGVKGAIGFVVPACSSDGVFCVQSIAMNRWDLYVEYGRQKRYLPESSRHGNVPSWCTDMAGLEYWFEL